MSKILSDYNSTGYSPVNVAKTSIYSDISLTFDINPITNDISPLTDIDAVKNSIKNLVLTNFHERPFDPALGSGITALLFEPGNMFTVMEIKNAIEKVINNNEPRISRLNVIVTDMSDDNAYSVTIQFTVSFSRDVSQVSFFLTRLR